MLWNHTCAWLKGVCRWKVTGRWNHNKIFFVNNKNHQQITHSTCIYVKPIVYEYLEMWDVVFAQIQNIKTLQTIKFVNQGNIEREG